jgi:hypothetical protein
MEQKLAAGVTSFTRKESALAKVVAKSQSKNFKNYKFIPDGLQVQRALEPGMLAIGEDGKNIMKKFANRFQTGRMNDAIRYQTRKRNNNTKFVVRIGWTELWYKYFGFQENGTKHVKAMKSSLRTYIAILPKINNYVMRFMTSYSQDKFKKVDY